MWIITEKNTDKIIDFFEEIEWLKNGYPMNPKNKISYPSALINVFEIENIPEYIERNKFCYNSNQEFFKNINYISPEELMIRTPEYQAGYDQAVLDLMEV